MHVFLLELGVLPEWWPETVRCAEVTRSAVLWTWASLFRLFYFAVLQQHWRLKSWVITSYSIWDHWRWPSVSSGLRSSLELYPPCEEFGAGTSSFCRPWHSRTCHHPIVRRLWMLSGFWTRWQSSSYWGLESNYDYPSRDLSSSLPNSQNISRGYKQRNVINIPNQHNPLRDFSF